MQYRYVSIEQCTDEVVQKETIASFVPRRTPLRYVAVYH